MMTCSVVTTELIALKYGESARTRGLLDVGPHAHGISWDQQLNLFGAELSPQKAKGCQQKSLYMLRYITGFVYCVVPGMSYCL